MHYIYMIVNKINGKTYIGQRKSNNWQDSYMGSGHYLACAKKKYGIENFEKFLIQYCNSQEEANKAEMFWIAEYRKRGKAEYNLADGGAGVRMPCKESTKKKLSDINKKNPARGMLGKHHSEESNQKNRLAHLGKASWNKGVPCSEETKRKISEAHSGQKAWNKGLKSDLKWFTNGIENRLCKECPDGFHKGRVSPTKNTKWKLVDGKRVYFKETLDV